PASRAALVSPPANTFPFRVRLPLSGTTAPVRIFTSVDFPAPLLPTSAWTSPPHRSKSTLSSAWTVPYCLDRPRAFSTTLFEKLVITGSLRSNFIHVRELVGKLLPILPSEPLPHAAACKQPVVTYCDKQNDADHDLGRIACHADQGQTS